MNKLRVEKGVRVCKVWKKNIVPTTTNILLSLSITRISWVVHAINHRSGVEETASGSVRGQASTSVAARMFKDICYGLGAREGQELCARHRS